MIEPITEQQKQRVIVETQHYIQQASAMVQRDIAMISVLFDLKGRSAGMYRLRNGQREIRYNPYIFAKYFDDNLAETVPHEVAHYVVDQLYGLHRVKPHGQEWRTWMQAFGVEPRATGRYDLTGIPLKSEQRFAYHCRCRTHQLTTRRHRKAQQGNSQYQCRRCGEVLLAE